MNRNKKGQASQKSPTKMSTAKAVKRNSKQTGISQSLRSQRGSLLGEVTRLPYREECLGSISTSTVFTNTPFVLNAANLATFPWLAPIAAKFEYYKFNRLSLKFVSSSADAVGTTNTALGTMIFNTNYDVLDQAFTSQIQMEDYGGGRRHSETIPSRNIEHPIEPQGIRSGVAGGFRLCLSSAANTAATIPYPSSSSAHDYDIGLLQCASVGAQAASVAGRLYICYQVDLANPKLETPLGQGLLASHYNGTVATTANNFATLAAVSGSNIVATFGTNTMTLSSPGRYLVSFTINGGSATGGLTFTADANGSVTSSGFLAGSGTATETISSVLLNVINSPAVFTMSAATVVAATSSTLWITQVPSGLNSVRPTDRTAYELFRRWITESESCSSSSSYSLSPPTCPATPFPEVRQGRWITL